MNFSRFIQQTLGGCTLEAAVDNSFYKGGGSTSTSTTTNKHKQDKQYGTLLKGADSWLKGGGYDDYYGGREDFDTVANMNQNQTGGIGGLVGAGGNIQGLYNTSGMSNLSDTLGAYDPNKTGLNPAIAAANEQSQFDFETGQMGNIRQGATDTGQYGSTRAGIAEGLARGRLAQGQHAVAANMYAQDQQQFNQRKQDTMQNLANITSGLSSGYNQQYQAGSLEQQQQQREILGELEKWGYANNVDANNMLMYKQMISGDMGGKTTNTTESSGGGGGIMSTVGTVGGAIIGGMYGGPAGASAGASIGGSVGGSMG